MNAQQIRQAYLDYFQERGHAIVPRANLVPQEDATTLFTGSGMQPMIPYLLGATHPLGERLADSQTCFRAEDIEEVGDNRHTTFFEMLGNWSLGDYFKKEQIEWMFEFLVEVVELDPRNLYITCFIGDPEIHIPKDTEAAEIWQKLFEAKGIDTKLVDIGSEADGYQKGMQDGRIFFYSAKKNWWSRGGPPTTTPVGDPCGPDSEMFYDFGTSHDTAYGSECHPNCDCGRFVELGNNVFMTYKKEAEGVFVPLAAPNIDHGSGLERIAAAAIGESDFFKISLLWPTIQKLEELSGKKYDDHKAAMRVVADHLRAAVWLAVDGVVPSNTQQGYVMRRLMRRAIRYGLELGVDNEFCAKVVPTVVGVYENELPEVAERKDLVIEIFNKEEHIFRQTLRKGVKEFTRLAADEKLSGEMIFKLYDTYGFPVELSVEEAMINNVAVDKTWRADFEKLMSNQKERSRTATRGTFKGGLGGQTLQHKKYHTATHLMYQALRQVLGDHVVQRGSNITEERLRFDFSHDSKVTPEQVAEVEKIVNAQIDKDLKVSFEEYPTKVAVEEKGALGQFGDRYGEVVKVYKMIADGVDKPFSFEICGGPHVDHTAQLAEDGKRFKIIKEESSSAGIRRIKALLV